MITRQACGRLQVAAWSCLILAGCAGSENQTTKSEGAQTNAVEVKVAEVTHWQHGSHRTLPGVVRPGRRAALSTRSSGTIKAIRVEAGDQVASGDVLAHVESRDVEAMVAAAKQQVQAAEAAYEQAVRDVERLQHLAAEDLIATNRLEQAQVKQRQAAAQAEKARSQFRVQQVNRAYTKVSAPFDGVVSEVLLDEGSFTGPGQPVLILEDRSRLRIDVTTSQQMAEQISRSKHLAVLNPLSGERHAVRYVATIPALETGGVGQRVRLAMTDPPATLWPGQVVDVLMKVAAKRDWVALPRKALIQRGQLTGTLVVKQEQNQSVVRLRWIQTVDGVFGEGSVIAVAQGLTVGEQVVLNPSRRLRDGQVVLPDGEAP